MLVAIMLHFAVAFNYHRFALERVFIMGRGLWRFPQGERHLLRAVLLYMRATYTMRLKVEKILQHHGHCFYLEKIFCAYKYPPLEMLRLNRLKVSSSNSSQYWDHPLLCGCYGTRLSVVSVNYQAIALWITLTDCIVCERNLKWVHYIFSHLFNQHTRDKL